MAVHREVAVGIRDPQGTTDALAFAFEEAALRGADLVAVHTWYWLPAGLRPQEEGTGLRPADPDRVTADAAASLAAMLDGWRDKYPGVPVRHDIIHGHPARVLASYSARADLVVLGRHTTHGALPGLGAVRHAVLNHAHGPVVTVPSS